MSHSTRLFVAVACAVLLLAAAPPVHGEPEPRPGQLVTVAGVEWSGYSGDGGDARQALLGTKLNVTVAANGAIYIADQYNDRLRVVTPDGVINTVPGAVDPDEWSWTPVAAGTDGAGVLYVATTNHVRRMNPDGTFTVIAGGGDKSYRDGGGGDGGPATDARLYGVRDMAVGADGTLYLADGYTNQIRRVTPDGTISTLAAGGVVLDEPASIAVAPGGTVYFVHSGFRGVQKIAPDGTVGTVLGQQARPGFSGDGGPADEAAFKQAGGIATDADGNLYVADVQNQNVRVIDTKGVIDTIGPSTPGLRDVTVGPDGDLYLTVESQVKRLVRGDVAVAGGERMRPRPARWVDQDPGTVLPVAGTGKRMTSEQRLGGGSGAMAVGGDGTVFYSSQDNQVVAIRPDGKRGPATNADLGMPGALAADSAGNLYVVDRFENRIHKVDTAGNATTVAGKGSAPDEGPNGDGGPAVDAPVQPESLAAGPDGSLYVADRLAKGRIRKIDPQGGIVSIVGGGERRIDETTNPAEVDFNTTTPSSLAVDAQGNLYFTYIDRVYVVSANGVLSAVTGAERGYAGDGGPAAQARLNLPGGLAIGPNGTVYIADTYNNRVRAIGPDGVLTTVAGTGARENSGDGGPATEAGLREPDRIATDDAGNLYVTASDAARIRKIDTRGVITTLAELDFAADGQRADRTVVEAPVGVAVDPAGTLYVEGETPLLAVAENGEVRELADMVLASGLAAAPDGSVYVANHDRVDRIHPDGATVTVAGGAASTYDLDDPLPDPNGKRATNTVLSPGDVAVAPSGELYLTSGTRVYRLTGKGTLKSIVDLGKEAESKELEIAVRADGEIYAADSMGGRVYAVSPSGEVRTFAGSGELGSEADRGDGDEATDASLVYPRDVAVDKDGTVYIATSTGIRRVSTDGDIDTVVEQSHSEGASALALDQHGNLYFAVKDRNQVFVVVRPGELPQPFPWGVLWLGLAVVATLTATIFAAIRYRGRPTTG